MAIHIKIRKHTEKNSIHYYHVETQFTSNHDFYIGIDIKKKLLLFFKTNNFSSPFSKISFEGSQSLNVKGIKTPLVGIIFVKAYRAFKSNEFPEILDYCA